MPHGGDLIADVLARHGATHLFTLCGGHISPILTGAQARGLRVIDVRDEVNAVFAADAVARMTGTFGVCATTHWIATAVGMYALIRCSHEPLVRVSSQRKRATLAM